ncbi:unnamed protein product [Sympodiomycopsis kandeliae]
MTSVEDVARRAKIAFEEAQKRLPSGSEADAARGRALGKIRDALEEHKEEIRAANAKDMEAASKLVSEGKLSSSLVSRLDLFNKPGKWDSMLQGLTEVANLASPLEICHYAKRLADSNPSTGQGAIDLYRVTCPIGVLLCIFEARPEVIINIASLAIKSGNAAILKGGKESKHTATVMLKVLSKSFETSKELPSDLIQMVETRNEIFDLIKLDKYIDLIIPRGSNELVRNIQENATIPVMGHADGLCSIYIHDDAESKGTVASILDAKLDYPAACNAVETLLINRQLLGKLLWAELANALVQKGVTIKCDEESKAALPSDLVTSSLVQSATPVDYDTEFLDLKLAVKTVSNVEEAIDHINTHGSHHTDAIFCAPSESHTAANIFTRSLSSANIFVNCSTRFADGFRYGFGTEVGISTGRTHARGPVGLDGLVTYKYIAKAVGAAGVQAAGEFGNGRQWSHKDIEKQYPPV